MIRLSLPVTLWIALTACTPETADTSGVITDTDTSDGGPTQPDADGDTIIDIHENMAGNDSDPDLDGLANMNDKESDGDTIRDRVEAGDADPMTMPVDSDNDGTPDFLDIDSDNNCVSDDIEAKRTDGGAIDTDGDGIRDFADHDNDGDTILDIDELGDPAECNPIDSDNDDVPDYMDLDADGDKVADKFESGTTAFSEHPRDSDGDGTPDFQDLDSDNDGMRDRDESGVNSIADEPRDTDGDGLYDFRDTDSDGDGLGDKEELTVHNTDPYDLDSDGDGFSDGGEVVAETDPNDSGSVIEGVYVEVSERTETEEHFVFEVRIQRGDIAMLTDTTCSMGGTINAVKTTFTAILNDTTATFEDVAGGAAGYDDYAYGSFGSSWSSDKPFYLKAPITTDKAAVQAGVNGLTTHGGSDGPESSMEALYQAASGIGYDQDCDHVYDADVDVKPFLASAGDPFRGTAGGAAPATPLADMGERGGLGFRNYSLPIIIYATDNYMRDPESSNSMYNGSPRGCPIDAGFSDVVSAMNDLGGYLVGVDVDAWGGGMPRPQMRDLATATNSMADMDDDGESDDLLVYALNTSSPSAPAAFSSYVVKAVDQLVQSLRFTELSLQVEGDSYGFVTGIVPERYTDIVWDETDELTFTLNFRGTVAATTEDQLFLLTLNILGDGTTLVGKRDIVVVVPGTSY